MARLILLNGPPGVGKSALAQRYLDDHPLALLLDIDGLRRSLGQWQQAEASMGIARTLAVALAEAHLRAGYDVILPQYLGRVAFIDTLEQLARKVRAELVELLLWDGEAAVADRFRARRAALAEAGAEHPEQDVPDAGIDAAIAEAFERLRRVENDRGRTRRISMKDGVDAALFELRRAIGDRPLT